MYSPSAGTRLAYSPNIGPWRYEAVRPSAPLSFSRRRCPCQRTAPTPLLEGAFPVPQRASKRGDAYHSCVAPTLLQEGSISVFLDPLVTAQRRDNFHPLAATASLQGGSLSIVQDSQKPSQHQHVPVICPPLPALWRNNPTLSASLEQQAGSTPAA